MRSGSSEEVSSYFLQFSSVGRLYLLHYPVVFHSSSVPQVSAMWARCEEHYNKKLWHQLCLQLEVLIKEATMQSRLVHIYSEFIVDFETKLDPLKLTQIGRRFF